MATAALTPLGAGLFPEKPGARQLHFLAPLFGRCVHISQNVAGD
jgi:hypothetical protein